jgi:hypothetical protein
MPSVRPGAAVAGSDAVVVVSRGVLSNVGGVGRHGLDLAGSPGCRRR